MDTELILKALYEARSLIYDESDSVCDIDLKEEYEQIIELLGKAINEVENKK